MKAKLQTKIIASISDITLFDDFIILEILANVNRYLRKDGENVQ